jgi:predicted N-acetyltransferase YhbS
MEKPAGVEIRTQEPADLRAVLAVTEHAFGSPVEAALVELIQRSANYVPELSFVAVKDAGIPGHVMLSYAALDDGARTDAFLLSGTHRSWHVGASKASRGRNPTRAAPIGPSEAR